MKRSNSLRYAILVLGPAYGTQQAFLAYQFASAVLKRGHTIETIFFYGEGVLNASMAVSPAHDEYDLSVAWQIFNKSHGVPLRFCSSAGFRRGISKKTTASHFKSSSLLEWDEVLLQSDRVIQF